MGKDSHRKKSQSEATPRSHHSDKGTRSSRAHDDKASYSRSPPYTPSRLSQVTNAGELSDVDAQAEALSHFSFSAEEQPTAAPLTFDTISEWVRQGGQLQALDDHTAEMLLSQYLGPKGDRSKRRKFHAPEEVPPPAPILEDEEEEDGGASLGEPSSASSSRHKDKGKSKAR
ncbi:hypothetical protein V2A60_009794 [Cordyceps javanica]|uniref:Uncharacterized protein n=1 Tax=Cordyceps javanica TaxID=43265 RepID=A0A545V098_9HYPO|nr:hypothetical protein IF1G_06128 [Cordyceps javanica]TQW05656.1 hypothetical protein IF2G_06778 [Cordyceps javanica]